jgi:hypothetical protein
MNLIINMALLIVHPSHSINTIHEAEQNTNNKYIFFRIVVV